MSSGSCLAHLAAASQASPFRLRDACRRSNCALVRPTARPRYSTRAYSNQGRLACILHHLPRTDTPCCPSLRPRCAHRVPNYPTRVFDAVRPTIISHGTYQRPLVDCCTISRADQEVEWLFAQSQTPGCCHGALPCGASALELTRGPLSVRVRLARPHTDDCHPAAGPLQYCHVAYNESGKLNLSEHPGTAHRDRVGRPLDRLTPEAYPRQWSWHLCGLPHAAQSSSATPSQITQ